VPFATPPHRLAALLAASTIALLSALVGAAGASAADSPVDVFGPATAPETLAREIAVAYWGVDPCGGQVTIVWTDQDPDLNATAVWGNAVGDYTDALSNDQCQIRFNPEVAFTWPKFCTVMVHEYGHLAGHDHSDDPRDVMYPLYMGPIGVCAPAAPLAKPATKPATKPTAKRATSRAKRTSYASRKRKLRR
jgi:hypothetical protein